MILLPPPPVDQMPRGTQLVAGLGTSTVLPDFDFETYSEAGYQWEEPSDAHKLGRWVQPDDAAGTDKGLPLVGLDRYASHPSTEVYRLSYNLKDGQGPRSWKPGQPAPLDLLQYLAAGGLIEAWNSGFELRIWNTVCTRRYLFPPLDPRQVRCAMAKARSFGLAGKLEVSGEVTGIPHPKLASGEKLVKLLSVPFSPTKKEPVRRLLPEHRPAEYEEYDRYNDRDILSEAEISALVPDLSPTELRYWQHDQAINQRGMAVDVAGMHACIAVVKQALARYGEECRALTGGIEPSQVQQLRGWLAGQGYPVPSLDAEALDTLLGQLPAGSVARRVVELRQLAGLASVKKVFALLHRTSYDGRLRDAYVWHGARTGRPTSGGVQSANLPKAGPDVHRCGWLSGKAQAPEGGCGRYFGGVLLRCPWCGQVRGHRKALEWNPEAAADAMTIVSSASLDVVAQFFGDALLTVAGCLRGLFVAGPGRELVSSDFTAIEGVVIACLAGEQWRIDAYAEGAPMYLLSASKAFGVPVQEMLDYAAQHGHHHKLRQVGKGLELACCFGGYVGSAKNFDVPGTDDEIKQSVLKWREASPAIVEMWGGQTRGAPWAHDCRQEFFGLEGAAVRACLEPGTRVHVMRLDGRPMNVDYIVHDDVLYCYLPSGRAIVYHRPRLSKSTRPYAAPWEKSLSFEGWNSNAGKGPPGWMRMSLYGGLLAENVTQAVARDIQMHAIDQCELQGLPVVMHTYDEIVIEVPDGAGDVEALERIMCDVPAWAAGWPIKAAGGWRGWRYRKA